MESNFLSFGTVQLNRLFPYFILLDTDMTITHMGEVLKNVCGDCIGGNLYDHFEQFDEQDLFDTQNFGGSTNISLKGVETAITGKWEEFGFEKSFLFAGEKLLLKDQQQSAPNLTVKTDAGKMSDVKEMFLANMSHEIRTPMNAIISMANELSKTTLTDEQDYYNQTIQTASKALLAIINDILDLSKIDAGKTEPGT